MSENIHLSQMESVIKEVISGGGDVSIIASGTSIYIALSLANGLLVCLLAGAYRKHKRQIHQSAQRLLFEKEPKAEP